MLEELDNLTDVDVNSRRGISTNFDLMHNPENQKFDVSDSLYVSLDLNNNGFQFHAGNGNIYISVRPNEEAVSYPGKKGHDKGKSFKSTTASELLEKVGLVGPLRLVEIGEKEGYMYYRIENIDHEDNEDEVPEIVDHGTDPAHDEDIIADSYEEETETETEELV